MPATEFLSWDGDPNAGELPRRPSTDDLGGDQKIDDAENPPDDHDHPTGAGWNHIVRQVAALARASAACKLEVRYGADLAPFIARVAAPRSNAKAGDFDVLETVLGTVEITWPGDFFPPHQCSPTGLTILSAAAADQSANVEEIANGIRVRTREAGAPARLPFTITIN